MASITKAYVLEDTDVEIVKSHAARLGNASDSAALRVIIGEWEAYRQARERVMAGILQAAAPTTSPAPEPAAERAA